MTRLRPLFLTVPLLLLAWGCTDPAAQPNAQTTANNGAANNGGTNNGATNNGATNNGATNNGGLTGALDGATCGADADCVGGRCLGAEDGYPGGYCTTTGCATTGICNGEAQCAFLDTTREESGCFQTCEHEAGCRDGYMCRVVTEALRFCLPIPPEPQPDGAPCTSREQCAGGVCLTEADGFYQGQCTTVGCERREDCTGDNTACLQAGRPNICVAMCERASDCREGYLCQISVDGRYCAPSPTAGTHVPREGELPFDIHCGSTLVERNAFRDGSDRHELRFTIAEGTTSFIVVPYSDGDQIYPVELAGPSRTLDMFGEYDFALANASFLINLSPVLIPQAPQFADVVEAGDYTLTMASGSDLCFYVIEKRDQGVSIDLNVHLVGADGITAATAPNNVGLQAALAQFDQVYQQLGVQLRNIVYKDVDGDDLTRFRIIRSQENVFRLVATSEDPGVTPDDLLTVNVFFVDDFAIDGGGVLGISAGLPGAAGLHGARGSGLVFSAAVLNEPTLLGQVLAHEVGHFLGLFHTSEQNGYGYDPVNDTEQCSQSEWRNPSNCPDLRNLMFPFAGLEHTELSDGQKFVLRANPLIK